MKKLGAIAVLFAAALGAAEFWQTKPYTEWTDKDVEKMLNASAWSKAVSVAVGAGEAQAGSSVPFRGKLPSTMSSGNPDSQLPGGQTDTGRSSRNVSDASDGMSIPTTTVIVRWLSALPVREAMARAKYGSEAGTSPAAKKLIETEDPNYVIVVSGLPKSLLHEDSDSQKAEMLSGSTLIVKGKEPIKPVGFTAQPNGKLMDAYFMFPKTAAFSLKDKEVDFFAKFQSTIVKERFQFKNMVVKGKLEL